MGYWSDRILGYRPEPTHTIAVDFFRQNAQAVASLRAPIFEEKVVDFLLELAKVDEKKVSREELYKPEDEVAA